MRRLTIAPNLALATLWADWLCHVGIRTTVQRVFAGSIAGELPPDQAQPELWIDDDQELQRAARLLDEFRHPRSRCWACPGCQEIIDGPFEQCWNCGGAMPALPASGDT
jgi:hypothetical protein